MAGDLTTVYSTLLKKLPILIRTVMLPLVLSLCFQAGKSDGCISSDILGKQLVGRKYFEIRSVCAFV